MWGDRKVANLVYVKVNKERIQESDEGAKLV